MNLREKGFVSKGTHPCLVPKDKSPPATMTGKQARSNLKNTYS